MCVCARARVYELLRNNEFDETMTNVKSIGAMIFPTGERE